MLGADEWGEVLWRSGPLSFGALTIKGFDPRFAACRRIQEQWKARWIPRIGDRVSLRDASGTGRNVVGCIVDIVLHEQRGCLDSLVVQSGKHVRYIDKRRDARWIARRLKSKK